MTAHWLPGTVTHFHATPDEVTACEWELAAIHDRLTRYAH